MSRQPAPPRPPRMLPPPGITGEAVDAPCQQLSFARVEPLAKLERYQRAEAMQMAISGQTGQVVSIGHCSRILESYERIYEQMQNKDASREVAGVADA